MCIDAQLSYQVDICSFLLRNRRGNFVCSLILKAIGNVIYCSLNVMMVGASKMVLTVERQ